MATLSFEQARACVLEKTIAITAPPCESVPLSLAMGRVLAQPVCADRDLPPAARSLRDGFAVRAADVPGQLRVVGEVRAGGGLTRGPQPGEAVEIMTGACVPEGADAVVMVEHVARTGDVIRVDGAAAPGDFIAPQASEAAKGALLLEPGTRVGFREIALLAATGHAQVRVYRKPRVAILPTGDELVEVHEAPGPDQVRNSNACSLAAQVEAAGGQAEIAGIARDNVEATRGLIEKGLECDLLLLSGGVSAGKYDLVEPVLESLGAEFFFDRVQIQPGQPVVFGRARGKFFFGLPGNPAATMVTFEIFARVVLERLSGVPASTLPFAFARLTAPFSHKPGVTRFLPARLGGAGEITPLSWKGSSDVPAVARANVFLVADAGKASWEAGELIQILLR